jgi:hypothetical protein
MKSDQTRNDVSGMERWPSRGMQKRFTGRYLILIFAAAASLYSSLPAQGNGEPLGIQGLNQRILNDVRSRGMGGTIIASGNNASVLFANPAGLTQLEAMEVRIGGMALKTSRRQTQKWVPNRLYTGLSIMMEDAWGGIPAPVDTNGNPIADPYEKLQKPFDAIGPNWSRKSDQVLPLSVAFAVPVDVGDIKLVLGVGGSQAIDLDYFFQNNNVTDPVLGQYRPEPMPELQQGDTLRVRWYQFSAKREGTVFRITPAVGAALGELSVGVSASYYTGTSDDLEQRLDRGFLTFLYNRFRVQDTVKFSSVRSGTSTYSGFGGTLGMKFKRPRYSVAATLEFPFTLEREFSKTFDSREDVVLVSTESDPSRTADSVQTTIVNTKISGTEQIHFPLAYAIGVLLQPFSRLELAFDYEARNLDHVEHTLDDGTVSNPWVGGSSFRFGAEYRWNEWLCVRGGYREVPQAFSPEGAAIIGKPAVMSVYSLGAGFDLLGGTADIAYENAYMRYQDSWQSNANHTSTKQHRLFVEFGYRF